MSTYREHEKIRETQETLLKLLATMFSDDTATVLVEAVDELVKARIDYHNAEYYHNHRPRDY